MKKMYSVVGMTCNGCRTNVEKTLNKVEGVKKAEVSLEKAQAEIESDTEIPLGKLQKALEGTHYKIDFPKEITQEYIVEGMQCMGCKNHVQEALEKVNGVTKADVDLEKGTAKVTSNQEIPTEKLQKELTKVGEQYLIYKEGEKPTEKSKKKEVVSETGEYYCPMRCEGDKVYDHPGDCPVCGMDLVPLNPTENSEDDSYKKLLRKFKIAIAFTLPIFIIAMSGMWDNNPLYKIMPIKYWDWIQFFLSIPVVFYACFMFFKRAYASLRTWNLNMFTLIGIGAGAAWIFSFVALLFPSVFPESFRMEDGNVHLYFESTTVILTLVMLGQIMEARAHGKTNSAIKELMKLAPNQATRVVNGKDEVIKIEEINKDDILKVKPGEKIPVDGEITEGEAIIDESMITGEPIPVEKKAGDDVNAGTINGNKVFLMKATKIGEHTLLANIIKMVNDASRSRAPIQKFADKVATYFVPIVVGVSVITFFLWWWLAPENNLSYAFVNAIAVLIIACPCALGLATPMSVMVGVGKGAQNGILIKKAEVLQKMNEVNTLVIDKTGTITEGKPSVENVITSDKITEEKAIQYINTLNQNSEHPLAKATLAYGKSKNIDTLKAENSETYSGKGIAGKINNDEVALGNLALLEELNINLNSDLKNKADEFAQQGKTVSYLGLNNEMVGFIVISDKIKEESKQAIQTLTREGIEVIMLTGDNEETAKAVADKVGLKHFKAKMLPEDKLNEIKALQEQGKIVAMAGDGINDAPALAQSNVGIAMGTGTDVAIESADITLVKGDLSDISKARILSKKVMRNIKENLFFALIYNTIGVPIAAGVLYPFFGILLSPMIAALAMSFSSVSVITNALRLRTVKLNKA